MPLSADRATALGKWRNLLRLCNQQQTHLTPFSSAFPDTKPVPFRYSPLSFINYTCTDASPSCDTDLALDVVFMFKDGSTFAKVHARAKRDASSPSKAALSVNEREAVFCGAARQQWFVCFNISLSRLSSGPPEKAMTAYFVY